MIESRRYDLLPSVRTSLDMPGFMGWLLAWAMSRRPGEPVALWLDGRPIMGYVPR